jgi:hypothetical protein
MYKELVKKLRHRGTLYNGISLFDDASDAIEKLLSENIQLKRRIVFWDKNTFGKLRTELDRLKRERDQAVEELHRNTDAVPVVRCKDCVYKASAEVIDGFLICPASGMEICDDDFCSYGKRKESNE